MQDAEIRKGIDRFDRWHYEFDLRGYKTPIVGGRNHANRHAQRRRYYFDPLVQHLGGTLRGKRVLDLGCNAGFWSLLALEAGADYVLGIDARPMHIEQAAFVFEAKEVDRHRYDFTCKNVFGLSPSELGTFDIVFCLDRGGTCKPVPTQS